MWIGFLFCDNLASCTEPIQHQQVVHADRFNNGLSTLNRGVDVRCGRGEATDLCGIYDL
jgi:hypothetical protein